MLTRRLFVGIALTPELKKRLRRESASWTTYPLILIPEENLHVTLLFLGFLPEERLSEICDAIEGAVKEVPTFEMHFNKMALTPEGDTPNMLWLIGDPVDELRLLRQGLEQALGYLLPERKSFRPHVNLARIRRKAWSALSPKPTLEKAVSFLEPVESVTLFESLSENGKRRYQPLMEFPLA